MTTLQVRRPDRSSQPILRVVRHPYRFFFLIKWSDMTNRTEDFFLHTPRRLRQSSIDGRLHIEAVVKRTLKVWDAAPRDRRRALFPRQAVIGKNLLAVLC